MIRALAIIAILAADPAHAKDNNPFSGATSIDVAMTRDSLTKRPPNITENITETCTASEYGIGDGYHGKRAADGSIFNTHALTAAHRTRSFGSHVTVTNRNNGRSVVVRITDRGPFVKGRCIDLSRAAALAIGMSGLAKVTVR